jgi:uroporphyrinogen decarboxylase
MVLNAIQDAKHDFVLLHIHGVDTYFDLLTKYPVDAINWHDRRTVPSLAERAQNSKARSSEA